MKFNETNDNPRKCTTIRDKKCDGVQWGESGVLEISLFDLGAERHAMSNLGRLVQRRNQSTVFRSGENEGAGI
jgi:hypothetical protein